MAALRPAVFSAHRTAASPIPAKPPLSRIAAIVAAVEPAMMASTTFVASAALPPSAAASTPMAAVPRMTPRTAIEEMRILLLCLDKPAGVEIALIMLVTFLDVVNRQTTCLTTLTLPIRHAPGPSFLATHLNQRSIAHRTTPTVWSTQEIPSREMLKA